MTLGQLFGGDGFWSAIRVEDLLDILLVAIALSVVLSWLKRRATRPLLFALGLGIAVYALARWLNLYLTLQLFRVGVLVLLAATLLAYQEDLRRGFERLATGQLFRRRKKTDSSEAAIAAVAEAAFDLAERKFGALVVIRGIEHLDRHLRGGWAVDGKPSVPLLLSVFDPHTPAHDGAAVIDERGRLDRVGVHLPLTSNLAALAGRGTRHAAALGLSENSDALVVVVSEERGTVSIARGGLMEPIPSEEALSAALSDFFDTHRPRPTRRRRGFWRRDLEAKLAALALAVALWLAFAAAPRPVQRTYPVTVELQNVPNGWKLEGPYPAEIDVTLLGPEPMFRELVPEDLRLSFDLAKVKPGENLINPDDGTINAPAPLRVARFDVETIDVTARPPNPTPKE